MNCVNNSTSNLPELQSWLDNNGGAAVTDGCSSGADSYTWTHDYAGGGIPALGTCVNDTTHILNVTFTATDDCDNTVQTSARFIVIDTSSPSLSATALDTIVNCVNNSTGNLPELQNWLDNNGGAAVTDGCSSGAKAYTWTHDYAGGGIPALGTCMNDTTHILNVTFTATDDCDNTVQTLSLIHISEPTRPY